MYKEIIEKLKEIAEPSFAQWLKPYINIGDDSEEIVLGVRTPKLRKYAKIITEKIDFKDVQNLLESGIHDAKALAIFILLIKSKKEPQKTCEFYLNNLIHINNWDLIDYSAPHIVAPNVDFETLRKLANSDYLWANRVAIVSTIYFIKQGDFSLTLEFAKKFINHKHHLMHKATGWMLREIGKKDEQKLREFLAKYSNVMPSIMRNYAKEKLK